MDGDLLLNVRVQTRAANDAFAEVVTGPLGEQIKIRIKAAPVDGKANKYLIAFLAKAFGVTKSNISILSGETTRDKRLKIVAPQKLPDYIKQASNTKTKDPVRE